MFANALMNWADVLVEHECNPSRSRLWQWLVTQARMAVDALVDIVEGRWPFGRYKDDAAEDDAMVLLRAKGWLVLPPETKARVEIRFLDELMPARQINGA